MKRYRQVEAFVLAGGHSSRMGQDKGLLEFLGTPLILRTTRLLTPLVGNVTIIAPPQRYPGLAFRVIPDQLSPTDPVDSPSHGPLAGIVTAVEISQSPWNLIVACDLPYLSSLWVDWFLTRAMVSQADVVIPRTARGLEPLAAIYRRECAAPLAEAFARGVRRVTEALAALRLDVCSVREWRAYDSENLVLRNMNTAEDYREARAWWEKRAGHATGDRVGRKSTA